MTTAHCGGSGGEPAAPHGLLPAPPRPAGRAPTSSRSSQCVPLPRKPAGQEPQAQEPSGKLLHSAPGKQGLDKQPSAGRRGGVRPGRAARVPLRTDGNGGQGAGVGADGQLGCRQTWSVRERRRAVRCGTGQPPGVTTPRGRPRVSPATASGCGARPAGLLSPRGAPQGPGAGLTAAPFAHLGLSFPRCVFCVFCAFGQNEGAVATGQAPVAAGGGRAGATHLWGSSSGCTSAARGRPPRRPGRRAAARGCCRRASAPGCLRRR